MFNSLLNPQVPALREDTENLIFFFHKLDLCYSLDNGQHQVYLKSCILEAVTNLRTDRVAPHP